jgi:serralysin
VVWRAPVPPDANESAHVERVRTVLERLASHLRTRELENRDAGSALASKIDIEVITQPSGGLTLAENEPLRLRLRNRSDTNLYVSVLMLDEFLGVEQIFPTTTTCSVLGAGRELTLAVAVRSTGWPDAPTRLTFKAFASTRPADLAPLTQPRLEQPFDLTTVVRRPGTRAQPDGQPAKSQRAPGAARRGRRSWVPGGPVALKSAIWATGKTLRVRFLGGDPALHKRVMDVAQEWLRHANLSFKVIESGPAEIRVSFKEDWGSWSYMGTECLSIPSGEPTMNLWVNSKTPRDEFRRVVLHEFGHALGLAAAQHSPIAAIPWRKQATYEYLRMTEGWTKAEVDANVFAKYDYDEVIHGPADPRSVMYHGIPKECTEGGVTVTMRSDLSAEDKRFIARLYPAESQVIRRAPASRPTGQRRSKGKGAPTARRSAVTRARKPRPETKR